MTENQWKAFSLFRDEFREKCARWQREYSSLLLSLQKKAAEEQGVDYEIENSVVYNTALDEITKESDIRLIVVGDNPGKNEQLEKNKKYLIGQSGKIAENFFRRTEELKTDFRKNAIILNKTPVHSAKTVQLKSFSKADGKAKDLIVQSQIFMAEKTAALLCGLVREGKNDVSLWLTGYSEVKKGKIFESYREAFLKSFENEADAWERVFVFQHFSMNRFLSDLRQFSASSSHSSVKENLEMLGKLHRREIFSM